jgi:hypothetical protein
MHLFLSDLLVGKPLSVPLSCTGLEGAPTLGTAILGVRRLRCFRGICASRQAVVAKWPIFRPHKSKGAELKVEGGRTNLRPNFGLFRTKGAELFKFFPSSYPL